jgi:hypothetical protein
MIEWETISDETYYVTKRLMVYGGRMVVHREIFDNHQGETITSIFVSDPHYNWDCEIQ